MAKTTGPLMSLDAVGKFAGALVFTHWKGRHVVRQLVTPANPNSSGQIIRRNSLRMTAEAQRWANVSTMMEDTRGKTDKQALIEAAPAGQAWNGWLVKSMIGTGGATMTAADDAWAALTAPQKAAWETAALALTPPFGSTYQDNGSGVASAGGAPGQGWFFYQYGLFRANVRDDIPGGTPPSYS